MNDRQVHYVLGYHKLIAYEFGEPVAEQCRQRLNELQAEEPWDVPEKKEDPDLFLRDVMIVACTLIRELASSEEFAKVIWSHAFYAIFGFPELLERERVEVFATAYIAVSVALERHSRRKLEQIQVARKPVLFQIAAQTLESV